MTASWPGAAGRPRRPVRPRSSHPRHRQNRMSAAPPQVYRLAAAPPAPRRRLGVWRPPVLRSRPLASFVRGTAHLLAGPRGVWPARWGRTAERMCIREPICCLQSARICGQDDTRRFGWRRGTKAGGRTAPPPGMPAEFRNRLRPNKPPNYRGGCTPPSQAYSARRRKGGKSGTDFVLENRQNLGEDHSGYLENLMSLGSGIGVGGGVSGTPSHVSLLIVSPRMYFLMK